MYINGNFVESETHEYIDVENPATEEILGRVPNGNEYDVEEAVKAASRAQREWGKRPAIERGKYLLFIADRLEERKEEFAQLLTKEQGKTLPLARGEMDITIEYFRYMAGWARRYEGDVINSDRQNENIILLKKPIGVVAGVVPWNFPMFVLARKVAPALITGCSIIIKPSQQTPLTAVKFSEVIHESELPPGIFQLVTGTGSSVGTPLASHKKVSMISLTGSTPAGSKVMEAAARNVTKVNLELGGKAPAIVSKYADLDLAAEKIIESRIINSGQVCTNAERVYVQEEVADEFIDKIVTKAKEIRYGNPLVKEDIEMGPLVSKNQLDSVSEAVEKAKAAGAKVLAGGQRADTEKGYFFEPTILTNVGQEMDIMQEEIFGPVLPITTYHSFSEAIVMANDSEYGLSSSIFTENYHEVMQGVNELEFGEVFVNRENFEALQGFHAGWRKSGIGGADGKRGLEEFLITTVAYMEYER
ncbi:aldehyde dehydrogenase [Thalassorhabdus alkalitolerans]|uniref:Aldehyde dehydrogenase n=1 Tax=Thalassorhabdus alkalitolerans TaxID=2282697 RepID=A0ABW0YN78_9BACI